MIRTLALICALSCCSQLHAQSAKVIDSLKRNIANHPSPDTFRVKAIYQYLRVNLYNLSDTRPYIEEMLGLSRHLNFPYGIRKALSMHVKYYGDSGDFERSFAYADSLLRFIQDDSAYFARRDKGIVYWDIANNYNKLADYNKSIEYYFLAVAIFEQFGDKNFLCTLYSNISTIYSNTADTTRAMEYTLKALDAAEASLNDDTKCFALLNYISELINRDQLTKARVALEQASPLVQRLENDAYSHQHAYNEGLVAQMSNDIQGAIDHFRQSLRFAQKTDDVYLVTAAMKALFDSYTIADQLSESRKYLDSALSLAASAGLRKRRKEVYDGLSRWYEKKGDYRNANGYLLKSAALNDSILSEENNKQIALLEMRYQVTGKEAEIQNLKTQKELQQLSLSQKNIVNYILLGTAMTILAISLLSYRNYKQKQKLQQQRIVELEKEKQLAATEAVLKGEDQERARLAKDLHDGLGGILSGIKYSFNNMKGNIIMTQESHQAFERSMDMLDSSIKEMRRVAHNLMPEALVRFGLDTALKDYCSEINQSGALQITYQSFGIGDSPVDATTAITIYRIVQELITNTMKHASATTAIVQLTKTDGQLAVTIEDDGKGFDTQILKQSTGIGWTNIQHRVDFLKGKVDVNSRPGQGTSVHIEFNV